jgi:hypothetical protein
MALVYRRYTAFVNIFFVQIPAIQNKTDNALNIAYEYSED